MYSEILAIALTLVASVTDIRSKKIPNWLTFPGALAGILCRWWQTANSESPTAGLVSGIEGWFLAVAIMLGTRYVAYLVGRSGSSSPVGFGDIKLMAALGACLGPAMFLCQLLVFSFLFINYGLVKIATAKGKISQTLQSRVTLAPFMALATICSIVFYEPLSRLLGM